jgi:hypothetical protein
VIDLKLPKWKPAVSFLVLAAMLIGSCLVFRTGAEDTSDGDLFRFVWDDSLQGYYIVSDQVFPLNISVLSLPDVGNYRFSNHSTIVEGIRQAVKIRSDAAYIKELTIHLWSNLFMRLNVSISFQFVDDWETYRALVSSGNGTIFVNTHDEYLPVPEGYTKEEWTDKIADFMLNRWGTWVHTGGYPFYRIWYQNGTKEEWGDNGFKRLMNPIGKGNVTCYPPPEWNPEGLATLHLWASQNLGINWFFDYTSNMTLSLADFDGSNQGYPIKYRDFEDQNICEVYSYESYSPGAIIHFSRNSSVFNFGIYVHMSPWRFYDGSGHELRPSEAIMGFISTAAAIYEEFSCAACKLYGRAGDSASEAIQDAEEAGRTVGLTEAKNLFQNASDAFASGNYKLSAAYAMQAMQTAEGATAPSMLPQAITTIVTIAFPIAILVYYKFSNNKNKKRTEAK